VSSPCVSWKRGRKVRIKHPAFGYEGKTGSVEHVTETHVLVHVILGKKPGECDAVKYLPEHLRLVGR
jgi:ribosomal protein L21E